VDAALDRAERRIEALEGGRLDISDRRLAEDAARTLRIEHDSVQYVGLLDKPDITWENPLADRFYTTMAHLYELNQRYQEIKHKSETLMDMTEVFTSLSHSRRAARLEWIIIVLIAIEILIYLFEIIRKA
jgi:uncharacterized Rmd1/YagE family protein